MQEVGRVFFQPQKDLVRDWLEADGHASHVWFELVGVDLACSVSIDRGVILRDALVDITSATDFSSLAFIRETMARLICLVYTPTSVLMNNIPTPNHVIVSPAALALGVPNVLEKPCTTPGGGGGCRNFVFTMDRFDRVHEFILQIGKSELAGPAAPHEGNLTALLPPIPTSVMYYVHKCGITIPPMYFRFEPQCGGYPFSPDRKTETDGGSSVAILSQTSVSLLHYMIEDRSEWLLTSTQATHRENEVTQTTARRGLRSSPDDGNFQDQPRR
ncbi:hypothetical protein J6590_085123 [Homalodisca vitripennis]|nr:hypothetical protein J6590_085123 [Homalodisca vitripennis]